MRATLLIVLGCLAGPGANAEDGGEMLVRVQDYAGVPAGRRAEAFAVAAEILSHAGASPVWFDCSPSLGEAMDDGCEGRPGAGGVILRLLPDKMAVSGLGVACLGYALIPRAGFGTIAGVFVDRARRKAEQALASRSVVLGHAIAHEIAHLLLGRAEHASTGLMRATWSRLDLRRATAVPMVLSVGEGRAIADNLRVRRRRGLGAAAD